jgi:hypothetical protein
MARDTLFIAGNGLTIDLIDHLDGAGLISKSNINSSSPFMEKPVNPDDHNEQLLDVFFELKETIEYIRSEYPQDNDFSLIEKITKISNDNPFYKNLNKKLAEYIGEADWLENGRKNPSRTQKMITERAMETFRDMNEHIKHLTRLFLVHSYIDIEIKLSAVQIDDWRWVKWYKNNYNKIKFCISFNYDLVLEKSFRPPMEYFYINSDISLYENSRARRPVAVFKPHGSINFEFSNKILQFSGEKPYNKRFMFSNNDAPVSIINSGNLNKARLSPDIVLPSERSRIANHSYNRKGFSALNEISSNIRTCVIVGLSFWEVDRPEIFRILSALHPSVKIIIISRSMNIEIDGVLRKKFPIIHWDFNELPNLNS